MLKIVNKVFADNIINYEVPEDTEDPNGSNRAINRYLLNGKLEGTKVKAAIQPLMRFRLLLQLGSSLGFNVRDITCGERTAYQGTVGDRFAPILRDVSKWYNPARKVQKAMSSAMHMADDFTIWKTDPASSGDVSLRLDHNAFIANITTLVKGILDSEAALLYKVKGNLQVLAYMVHWHMTVSVN